MIKNGNKNSENDLEKSRERTSKKRHKKYLKENRIIDIDEIIKMPKNL